MADSKRTLEPTPANEEKRQPKDPANVLWVETEFTVETTTHGRNLNPPCPWAVTEEEEAEFEEFKQQALTFPRWSKLHGRGLRQTFFNTRPKYENRYRQP